MSVMCHAQVSLGWVYLFMGIVIGSAVIPITLSLFWCRLTAVAMTTGAVAGAILGLFSWIVVSALHPAGLADFFTSTGTAHPDRLGSGPSLTHPGPDPAPAWPGPGRSQWPAVAISHSETSLRRVYSVAVGRSLFVFSPCLSVVGV